MPYPGQPITQRVQIGKSPDDCWLWLGPTTELGHGKITFGGPLDLVAAVRPHPGRPSRSHRVLNPGEHENVHPPQRSRPARTVRQCDRSSRIRYLVWRAGSGRRSQSDDDLRVSTMRGRTSGLGHYLRPVFAWTHLLHLEVHEHPLRRPAAWGAVIVRGKTDEPANFGEVYEAGPRNEVVARLTPHAVQILGRSDLPTSGKARAPIFPTPSKNRSPYGEARDRWVDRCISEGALRKVLLLIPAHTETRTFQRALQACTSVLLVRSRLRFGVLRENGRQEAASHGSALFGFGVDLSPLAAMGTILRPNGRA